MTEVFLFGTFHFLEQKWDIGSESLQREISELVGKLASFRPEAVAVEGPVHQQAVIDAAYRRVSLSDFDDAALMRTGNLGEITAFGQNHPISWNNETIQIGFRLAKQLNLDCVHAIDADMLLDDTQLGNYQDRISAPLGRLLEYTRDNKGDTLVSNYLCHNTAEWSRLNHQMYLTANSINEGGRYNGTTFMTQWYERNLRIFSEIQALAGRYKRIFVLYGAGHLQILRDLISASEDMKLISADQYL